MSNEASLVQRNCALTAVSSSLVELYPGSSRIRITGTNLTISIIQTEGGRSEEHRLPGRAERVASCFSMGQRLGLNICIKNTVQGLHGQLSPRSCPARRIDTGPLATRRSGIIGRHRSKRSGRDAGRRKSCFLLGELSNIHLLCLILTGNFKK